MDDDVCVVGMACRLPGAISSPRDLWQFLINNQSAQGAVPQNRFSMEGFYGQDGSRAGILNAAGGYFLADDPRQFDNKFFGINNLEAISMDPQQRKLLEVVFECLEHAGLPLERASGSNIGVYVGSFTVDHQTSQTRDPDSIHRYTATGCGTTILANRISHVFGLHGPSLTLDTACSSSLYCLHTAVNAIKLGDCDSAIVAGVNLIISPEQCLGTAKAGVLSPTSTCHTFDASANGYGRAEGVNAVYLKKHSQALEDGDKIWAVIRGTAVNANGKTPGITQPSAELQEAVIRKAYSNARLDFSETDYIECHGTGTPVGDPIEVEAVSRCFSRDGAPLMIGSSKPNLGHSEAASGLTALIKVILALEYGKIPPTYGVTTLNPKLQLQSRNMQVVKTVQEWPRALRRASVNAFGYGGANAHAILESTNGHHHARNDDGFSSCRSYVLPISAKSIKALKSRADAIDKVVSLGNAKALSSLAWNLAERRNHFSIRRAILAEEEADGHIQMEEIEGNSGQLPTGTSPIPLPLGFIFTGQGAQHPHMARGLLQNSIFSQTIRALDEVLHNLPHDQAPDWTLEQTILDPPETSQINHVTRSQPVCTAVQIALVDLLHTWGIEPSGGVIGHSSGEIAAAYAAGSLNATQAILVAYFRGFAVDQLGARGAMLAASISFEEAKRLLQAKGVTDEVCVACINSPQNVTLSGSHQGIDVMMTEIREHQHKFARKLSTDDRAYHSHLVKEAGALYERLISPYFTQLSQNSLRRRRFFSTVLPPGSQPASLEVCVEGPGYWRKNLELPVQFHHAVETLVANKKTIHLIEIGPHPALKGPLEQIRQNIGHPREEFLYDFALTRGTDSDASMKRLAGSLFLQGHALKWRNVNFGLQSTGEKPTYCHPETPPYPWDYSAGLLWQEPRMSAEIRCRQYPRHELLGSPQVAGNGLDWSWRNVVQLEEVPWLRDHKLDQQTVLPAACYLAMAMEALTQIRSISHGADNMPSFNFQRVNFNSVLVIPDKTEGDQRTVEIHTGMSAQRLSTTATSGMWYEFTISSWDSGKAVVHCTGRVRLRDQAADSDNKVWSTCLDAERAHGFEEWTSTRRWYENFKEGGLTFGPSFRSITNLKTDVNRRKREALCKTVLKPPLAEMSAKRRSSSYPVHPITIDACFQLAIMSATAGNIDHLQVCIPAFIEECQLNPARQSGSADSVLHARANRSGILTERIDSDLLSASGESIIRFKNVKMYQYMAKTLHDTTWSREPCLRVAWKPDPHKVTTRTQKQFSQYLQASLSPRESQESHLSGSHHVAVAAGLLDLLGHKNPRMHVLELVSACQNRPSSVQKALRQRIGFQVYQSWQQRNPDGEGVPVMHSEGGPFDVILVLNHPFHHIWNQGTGSILLEVARGGSVITRKTSTALKALNDSHFNVFEIAVDLLFAVRPILTIDSHTPRDTVHTWRGQDVVIVRRESDAPATPSDFCDFLAAHLRHLGVADIKTIDFGDEIGQIQWRNTICISLLEIEQEFFATMNQHDMDMIRKITNQVRTLVWVTGAGMLGNCPKPGLALCNGLSRALMLEQPALNFVVLDVGPISMDPGVLNSNPGVLVMCQNILKVLEYASDTNGVMLDKEFILKDGILHISRFIPDLGLNGLFQRRLSKETARLGQSESSTRLEHTPLKSARPARLAIGQVGISESIHFQQVREPSSPPGAGFIDVLVRAVSLNAKDVYALNGRIETCGATVALEFSGVVTATGPDVTHLQPGDRAVVLAPCHFSTTERVPAWAAHKMLPGEKHCVLSTLPVIFSTALYALRYRGRLQTGESVLIHCGAGAFGLAAIAVAQRMGAVVYTTASTAERRDFIKKRFGIPMGRVFQSRDSSFADGIRSATKGRGVDLVINSLVGDLMHTSWDCVAPFGRFIEIGKRELVDAGRLDMHVFLRNATFTAFDLSDLFFSEDQSSHDILRSLVSEVLESYRAGQIDPVPTKVFPVSDIVQAYRYFSSKDRIGKVVVSLEDDLAPVPVKPSQYSSLFDPNKVYLLVGCLGGLGRSLSRWMLARGARYFLFLGRSGCDKRSAKDLVSHLKADGAHITVCRGDVSNAEDVAKAVQMCDNTGKPIGGVVQAAMGLNESVFATMSNEAWHTGIRPKWQGTLNLHRALRGTQHTLDFFLMTSSVSGTVGTATESNYCAANSFMDAFAYYLRLEGLPAVSVGLGMISEVGYLHENPEIEALLMRRGVQPLTEAEFLQVVDLALSDNKGSGQAKIEPWSAHILTGLEPLQARRLMENGFDVSHGAMDDPRASILTAIWEAERKSIKRQDSESGDPSGVLKDSEPWFKVLPPNVAGSLLPESNAPSLHAAVLRLTRKRFSNLLLLPVAQIEDKKPLNNFGIDSMIASEFRMWIWTTFKVEIPLLDLMDRNKTIALLSEDVEAKLLLQTHN